MAAVGVVTGEIMTMEEEDTMHIGYKDSLQLASATNAQDMVGFAKAMIGASRLVMKPQLHSPALMRVGIHTVCAWH